MNKRQSIVSEQKVWEAKRKSLEMLIKLLEKSVTEEFLVNACNYFSQEDYADVTIERSIIHLCGYPLCPKQIKEIKQKYHISAMKNKIYDITERKRFCSNLCYKASNFLKAQIPDCALWMKEKSVAIKLLSTVINDGSAGDEVDIGELKRVSKADINAVQKNELVNLPSSIIAPYLPDGLENCSKQFENLKICEKSTYFVDPDSLECTLLGSDDGDHFSDEVDREEGNCTLNEISDSETNEVTMEAKKYVKAVSLINDTSKEIMDSDDKEDKKFSMEHEKYDSSISINKYMPVTSKHTTRRVVLIDPMGTCIDGRNLQQVSTAKGNSVVAVDSALREWISEETFLLLLGEVKYKCLHQEFIHQVAITVPDIKSDRLSEDKLTTMKKDYVKICSKLNEEELMELNDDDKCESKSFEIKNSDEQNADISDEVKVAMFYQQQQLDKPDDFTNKSKKSKKRVSKVALKKKSTREIPPNLCPLQRIAPLEKVAVDSVDDRADKDSFLPLVDNLSQTASRRRLVGEKLKMIYNDILPLVGLQYSDISACLKKLLSSFRMSSKNISFRPAEWKILSVALFRMMEKFLVIECTLDKERCWKSFQKMLNSCGTSMSEIDSLLSSLTDLTKLQKLWQAQKL